MKNHESYSIVVEALIPFEVPPEQRHDFETAVVEFLTGRDRLRPELAAAVQKRGVDVKQLAKLTMPRLMGLCPTPGALEFVPGPELAKIAHRQGLSFTSGGKLGIEFKYAPDAKAPHDALRINLRIPSELAKHLTGTAAGEIVTALFGDCELPQAVQDYLAAHGVDLNEIIRAEWKHAEKIPPTTRVSPETAARLKKHGFNTEQYGQIKVLSISALA